MIKRSMSTLYSISVSGENLIPSQYSLNDSLCESWVENVDNETERCEYVNKTLYCFGDLDFPRMDIR